MKRRCFFFSCLWPSIPLIALMIALPPAVSWTASTPAQIGIGTNRVGLAYHAAGVGIAKVISEKSPMKVLVKPFAGPNAWMPLLDSGELELGLISGTDAGWAFTMGPGFPRQNKNLRVLMRGNMIDFIVVVKASSDFRKVSDLKARRVTSDYGGNVVVKQIVEAYLASAGLGWDDVKRVPVPDIAAGLQALREGRVDAAFGGGPVTGALRELDAAIPVRALPFELSAATLAKARELLPSARPVLIKKGTGILREDIQALEYPIFLVASAKLAENTAYEVVKALWENYKDLHPIHPWLKGWIPEEMFDPDPPAPYHPGAVKFYREKNLWGAEAQKNQTELIGAAK